MALSLPLTQELHDHLTYDRGFKHNGHDYYKNFAVTNLETSWEEEVYISRTDDGFEVWFPDGALKNQKFKTEKQLRNYLDDEMSIG